MIARLLRRFPWLEPWYDWGRENFFRLDQIETDFSDETEGEGWHFTLQWFGLHFHVVVGRIPPMVSPELIAERKLAIARSERGKGAKA